MSPRRVGGAPAGTVVEIDELLVEVPNDESHVWPGTEIEVWSEFQRSVIRYRRAYGLDTKRRHFIARCVDDNSIVLLTTGPKGLSGKSTWKGRCPDCGRAVTKDPRPVVIQETTVPEPEDT